MTKASISPGDTVRLLAGKFIGHRALVVACEEDVAELVMLKHRFGCTVPMSFLRKVRSASEEELAVARSLHRALSMPKRC